MPVPPHPLCPVVCSSHKKPQPAVGRETQNLPCCRCVKTIIRSYAHSTRCACSSHMCILRTSAGSKSESPTMRACSTLHPSHTPIPRPCPAPPRPCPWHPRKLPGHLLSGAASSQPVPHHAPLLQLLLQPACQLPGSPLPLPGPHCPVTRNARIATSPHRLHLLGQLLGVARVLARLADAVERGLERERALHPRAQAHLGCADHGQQQLDVLGWQPVHQALPPHQRVLVNDALHPRLLEHVQRCRAPGIVEAVPIVPDVLAQVHALVVDHLSLVGAEHNPAGWGP
mmetsp:Transcript_2994/g.7391  ORF Transcript_2994/g.7391 Transcript_2994/m.7391 type:complete len:285 (+) Transcript_2994:121-975(+)